MKVFFKPTSLFGRILMGLTFMFMVAAPLTTLATPQPAAAACNDGGILGIPPWYRGLTKDENGSCVLQSPDEATGGDIGKYILKIALNVVEIIISVTAFIAFFFILYGGFQYVTGGADQKQTAAAFKTLLNAIIGLGIALSSIAIIKFVFQLFDGADTNGSGIVKLSAAQLLDHGLNMVYFIAGVVAVIVIIVGGLNYATSGGDPAKMTKGKNLIVYAVVGLGIVLAAFAVTSFVIGRFQ